METICNGAAPPFLGNSKLSDSDCQNLIFKCNFYNSYLGAISYISEFEQLKITISGDYHLLHYK